jgi:hypothetical protein
MLVTGLSEESVNAHYDETQHRIRELSRRISMLQQNTEALEYVDPWANTLPGGADTPPPIDREYWWSNTLIDSVARLWTQMMNEQAPPPTAGFLERASWARFRQTDENRTNYVHMYHLLSDLLDRMSRDDEEKARAWDRVMYEYLFDNGANFLREEVARHSRVDPSADTDLSLLKRLEFDHAGFATSVRTKAGAALVGDAELDELKPLYEALPHPLRNGMVQPWQLDTLPFNYRMYERAVSAAFVLHNAQLPIPASLDMFVTGKMAVRDVILRMTLLHNDRSELPMVGQLLGLITHSPYESLRVRKYLGLINELLSNVNDDVGEILSFNVSGEQFANMVLDSDLDEITPEFKNMVYAIENGQPQDGSNAIVQLLRRCFTMDRPPFDDCSINTWLQYVLAKRKIGDLQAAAHPELYLGPDYSIPTRYLEEWMRSPSDGEREKADDWFYRWSDLWLIRDGKPPAFRLQREIDFARQELEKEMPVITSSKHLAIMYNQPIDESVRIDGGTSPYRYEWFLEEPNGKRTALDITGPRLRLLSHRTGRYFCRVTDSTGLSVFGKYSLFVKSLITCLHCHADVPDIEFGLFGLCTWTPMPPGAIREVQEIARRAVKLLSTQNANRMMWYKDMDFGYVNLLKQWNIRYDKLTSRIQADVCAAAGQRLLSQDRLTASMYVYDVMRFLNNRRIFDTLGMPEILWRFIENIAVWLANYYPEQRDQECSVDVLIARAAHENTPLASDTFYSEELMRDMIQRAQSTEKTFRRVAWKGAHSYTRAAPMEYAAPDAARGDYPINTGLPFDALANEIANTRKYSLEQRRLLVDVYNAFAFNTKSPIATDDPISVRDMILLYEQLKARVI